MIESNPDILRYSVVLIDNHPVDNPTLIGEWEPRNDDPPSWDAVLDANEFSELCKELGLRASCTTQGTQGAAGFEPLHWVPAYCFCDEDENYMAWVTPWTPAVKAAALDEIAGQTPIDIPVFGLEQPVSAVGLPLWGDRWPEVERMLDLEFSDERGDHEIEPVEKFDIKNTPAAPVVKK